MNIQSGFTSFGLVLSSNSNASRLLNKIFAGWDRSFEKLKSRVCFLLWLKDSNFNFLWWEFLAQIWEPREPTIENPILRSSKCVKDWYFAWIGCSKVGMYVGINCNNGIFYATWIGGTASCTIKSFPTCKRRTSDKDYGIESPNFVLNQQSIWLSEYIDVYHSYRQTCQVENFVSNQGCFGHELVKQYTVTCVTFMGRPA